MQKTVMGLMAAATSAASASAAVTFTFDSTPAPTYSTTLNFDEPGSAVGPVTSDNWQADLGITVAAGDGAHFVQNFETTPGFEWLGDDNVFQGGFGVFINFDEDVTEFSTQVWDNAGPPGPIGGGMFVIAFDDGVEVLNTIVSPTFSDTGPTWLDIVATGGDVFDEVRLVGLAFAGPVTYVDNMSWNAIPAPASLSVLGLAGWAIRRRRI